MIIVPLDTLGVHIEQMLPVLGYDYAPMATCIAHGHWGVSTTEFASLGRWSGPRPDGPPRQRAGGFSGSPCQSKG